MANELNVASKKELFKIPHDTGVLVEVEGRRTDIDGLHCFIHYDEDAELWVISHLESGCQIANNKSKSACGVTAWMRVTNNPERFDTAKDLVTKNGFSYPVNS